MSPHSSRRVNALSDLYPAQHCACSVISRHKKEPVNTNCDISAAIFAVLLTHNTQTFAVSLKKLIFCIRRMRNVTQSVVKLDIRFSLVFRFAYMPYCTVYWQAYLGLLRVLRTLFMPVSRFLAHNLFILEGNIRVVKAAGRPRRSCFDDAEMNKLADREMWLKVELT